MVPLDLIILFLVLSTSVLKFLQFGSVDYNTINHAPAALKQQTASLLVLLVAVKLILFLLFLKAYQKIWPTKCNGSANSDGNPILPTLHLFII